MELDPFSMLWVCSSAVFFWYSIYYILLIVCFLTILARESSRVAYSLYSSSAFRASSYLDFLSDRCLLISSEESISTTLTPSWAPLQASITYCYRMISASFSSSFNFSIFCRSISSASCTFLGPKTCTLLLIWASFFTILSACLCSIRKTANWIFSSASGSYF